MKPENKAFLEANRHHWITLRDAQYCRHLDGATREGMRRVMAEEFRPGYSADLWCPPCVAEMVTQLYRDFEKWEAANPPVFAIVESPEPIPEGHAEVLEVKENGEGVKTVEPFTPPIQTNANFPSHKKHPRR